MGDIPTWQQTAPPRTNGGWNPVNTNGALEKESPVAGPASALARLAQASQYDRDTWTGPRKDIARRLMSHTCPSDRRSLSGEPLPHFYLSAQKALAALESESTGSSKATPRRRCGTGG